MGPPADREIASGCLRHEPAWTSSRRWPCRGPVLTLGSVRYVHLDEAHEEEAVAALADLLARYVDDSDEEEEAA